MSDSNVLLPIEAADLGTLLMSRPSTMPQRVEFWIDGKKRKKPIHSLVMRLVVPNRANIQIVYGANSTIGANGADDITRREPGGVVSVYYTFLNGRLYIGLLRQMRPCQNMTDSILNVLRGYLEPGKSRVEQTFEKAENRVNNMVTFEVAELPGEQANGNNAWVETWGEHGNSQFAFTVPSELLVPGKGDFFVFDPATVKPIDVAAEKVLGMEFHPWKVAARVGDDFTRAIVSSLMAWLDDSNQINVL
jgi:hypothetical protein